MYDYERNLNQDKKEAAIASGRDIIGREKVNLYQVDSGDVLSFIYDAESSGFPKNSPGYGYYDMNPQIVVLNVKKNKNNGKLYIDGLNVNYVDKRIERSRIILFEKAGFKINRAAYKKLVHRYSLERIKSSLYKSNDWFVDISLLNSLGDFVRV